MKIKKIVLLPLLFLLIFGNSVTAAENSSGTANCIVSVDTMQGTYKKVIDTEENIPTFF